MSQDWTHAFCRGILSALFAVACGFVYAAPHPDARAGRSEHPSYQVGGEVMTPRLFAKDTISTVDDEIGGSFSLDGKEFYFSRLVPYTTLPRIGVMLVSYYRDGRWSDPQILPFSGKYLDFPPRFSADGQRMFFASSRPLPDGTRGAIRIWQVERSASGWGEPSPLPLPINLPGGFNADPSVAADGTLYFTSDRGDPAATHIYRSKFINGKYTEPEKLGPEINSSFNDAQPFISMDQSKLIFSSTGSGAPPYAHRPQELTGGGKPYPRGDLYISYNREGKWSPAHHLEHGINTEAEEEYPFLTPDGRYLFFSSERSAFTVPTAHRLNYQRLETGLHSIFNGHGNVFFVDVEALELP